MAVQQPPSGPPPRFVPTLTEVVQIDEGATEAPPSPAAPQVAVPEPPAVPGSGLHQAPAPESAPVPAPALQTLPAPAAGLAGRVAFARPHSPALPHGIEEYIVHRVMQRVDLVLDMRLREAIATVVQEQTRSIVPRLREEVESVVRHAVYEAVADELSADRTPPL